MDVDDNDDDDDDDGVWQTIEKEGLSGNNCLNQLEYCFDFDPSFLIQVIIMLMVTTIMIGGMMNICALFLCQFDALVKVRSLICTFILPSQSESLDKLDRVLVPP